MADPELYASELKKWERVLHRTFKQRRNRPEALSAEQIDFLTDSFTAICDTLDEWFRWLQGGGSVFDSQLDEMRPLMQSAAEELLAEDRERVLSAAKQLADALNRQLSAADAARKGGGTSKTRTLNEFYRTLTDLKRAVKLHSQTPSHRPRENDERDKAIYEMARAGKSYGQISLALARQNPLWKVTPKQAERADKRYRERSRTLLRSVLHNIFSRQPT